jgi:hypothetical protein
MKKTIFAILLILFASIAVVYVSKGNFSSPTGKIQSAPKTTSKTTSDPQLSPSLTLLGAGAQWAAFNGTNALYVDFYDNIMAYPNPNAPNSTVFQLQRADVSAALEQYGFNITYSPDIPSNLSAYNVVVIDAYWACEPSNEPIVRAYISGGGGVVLIAGVPVYLSTYCTNWWAGGDLSLVQDWFGASYYLNAGMESVTVMVNNPFGTSLSAGSSLGQYDAGSSYAAVGGPLNDSTVIAQWADGSIFSMTHEYGQGRVYYQASYSDTLPPQITAINISPSQPTSNDTVQIDVSTNEPQIASASLTLQFSYTDNFGQLWNTKMNYNETNNVWQVILPQQPSGTNVQFSVTVSDNNGNQAYMESNYTVS